jgi:ADP-ribose pyrophosphatase YjhB (NUDIX family)
MKRALIGMLRWLMAFVQRGLNVASFGHWPSAVAACTIVLDDDGRILLVERADGTGLGLPGGFVDLREHVADAAVRETREETGIDVELLGLVGILSGRRFPGVSCVDLIFAARPTSGDAVPAASFEGACAWYRYDDIRERLAFDYHDVVHPYLSGHDLPASHARPFGVFPHDDLRSP